MSRHPLFKNIQRLFAEARNEIQDPGSVMELEQRRLFLKRVAQLALLATPPLSSLVACSSAKVLGQSQSTSAASQNFPDSRSLTSVNREPVIILGAGIAGLTTAFYLVRSGIACELFEASPRVGGRMYTRQNFNSEGMFCELGGEFVDSDHKDIIDLCRFFGIPVDDFGPGDRGLAQNLYYFSNSPMGHRSYYTDQDAIQVMREFDRHYSADCRRAETPDGAKYFDSMSLQQYLDTYRGKVDHWFLEMLRIAYVGEEGVEANEQSALNMIGTLNPDTKSGFQLYGSSDQSKRIRGGNQSLIGALETFLKRAGVQIHTRSPLIAIREKSQHLTLTFGGSQPQRSVAAQRVVCTMPFSRLRRVDGIFELNMTPEKKIWIRDMSYGTGGKHMLGFHDKVWRHPIHIGQTTVPASNGMVYSDLFVQNIWETSRAQPRPDHVGKSGILTVYQGGHDGARVSLKNRDRNLEVINMIYPGTREHYDGNQAAFNWTHYPYNLGSYAVFRPGQITRFSKIGGQPELNARLLFAGEHVDTKFGGYMDGACRSGRIAAQTLIAQTQVKSK